jgi:hypothetical protein
MFEAEHPEMADIVLISDIFEFWDLFEVNNFFAVPKSATYTYHFSFRRILAGFKS